jgi:hypothetical protein
VQNGTYTPVDLTDVFNASVDILEDPHEVSLGDRLLHGLPFAFGDRTRSLVKAEPRSRVSVPLNENATWLVFAHAILETDLFEGGSIGENVGSYEITYADQTSVTVPLSQRYEIGPTPRKWLGHVTPLDWGQTPFLAVNDAEHELMPRVCGRFDEAGARLVEIEDPQSRVPYILPYRFYIWAWKNPQPDKQIESVHVSGGEHHTVILGALTRSTLAEEPINRSVARDVLLRVDEDRVNENLEVEVDRGTQHYVYPLQPHTAANSTGVPAWGSQREGSAGAYTKIAASPSATVTVKYSEEVLGSFRWQDLLERGELVVNTGLQVVLPPAERTWVKGSVVDADTGEPLACRLRFVTADGVPYAPHGHQPHLNSEGNTWNLNIGGDVRLGGNTYAFVDGQFEGWLPDGELFVEMSRGFTYVPEKTRVEVGPAANTLELKLKRQFNPLERGYMGGDTHVHFVSTKGGELEARAEDLQVVNLLQTQWGQLFTSAEEFTGQPEYARDGSAVVFAGQENRTNMLGHINLLGLREPIMPWCTGGSEEAELGGGLDTTLSRWADECRAQGGAVVLAHFPVPYGETSALLATGRLDAVESIGFDNYNIGEYYRYLNAGFQIPLAAGTDKMTAEVPVGMMRTYAAMSQPEVDYWDWCDGIKRGQTMISSGPLLWVDVDGEQPGGLISAKPGQRVTISGELESIFPVDAVEILVNGQQVDRIRVPEGTSSFTFSRDIRVDGDSWIVVRCFGTGSARHHDTWDRFIFAHTSPVYITVGEQYYKYNEDTMLHLMRIVEGARRHVLERARTKWDGGVTHRHRQHDHDAFLVQPFDEAIRELNRKMRTAQ